MLPELPKTAPCLFCDKKILGSKTRNHNCAPKRVVERRVGRPLATYDLLILWDVAQKELETCGTTNVFA